jgi:hypothetical protein
VDNMVDNMVHNMMHNMVDNIPAQALLYGYSAKCQVKPFYGGLPVSTVAFQSDSFNPDRTKHTLVHIRRIRCIRCIKSIR